MGHGHGHHGEKTRSLIPIILAVAILGYGFGFALRADDSAPRPFQPNAGPGYFERLPAKGPENAPVVLVEVADLRCVYCKKRNALLKRIFAEHEHDVRIVFKHFPFVSPQYSERGAVASMAASRQGRFWEYVDSLYLNRDDDWSDAKLVEYADTLGLDTADFQQALSDRSLTSYVRYDRAAAEALNIRATPTILINGITVPNWANAADIRQIIRATKAEVVAMVESGDAANYVEARAKVAAKNHPAGDAFAKRYMYNDVSDLRVVSGTK